MDLTTTHGQPHLAAQGSGVGNIDEVIRQIQSIENPLERYDNQQIIMERLLETHDGVDDAVEKFFVWMSNDRAYEATESVHEFEEKYAQATGIVEANRLRRNKLVEATAEVGKRWGEAIIPALTEALGAPPSSTLLQRVRKLAGQVDLSEGILRVNRVIYQRLATPTRGVRAVKAVMPSDFRKAVGCTDSTPLTLEELEQIGMQIGQFGLLVAGFVSEQVGAGARAGELEGPALELRDTGSDSSTPAANGTPTPQEPLWNIRCRARTLPRVVDPEQSSDGDDGADDEMSGPPAKKSRGCGCSVDGPATWTEAVSKRAPVTERVALRLLDGMMEKESVCYKHLRDLGGKIGLRVKKLGASELRDRLQRVQDNRTRIGDLKAANDTVLWFRRRNRPAHPSDGLGTYRFAARDMSRPFQYDQAALREKIGGINMEDWVNDGSVNVDLFGWWWDTGIIDLILSEYDMYHYHLREPNGNSNWGWLRNMYHSTGQQLMRQDPLYYALYAALRPDKHWRLASYPYYAKYNKKGDWTHFRHIDINIPQALENGKGVHQIQGTLSLDDEDESRATIILAGTHIKQLGQLWAKICARNQQTDGYIHRFTNPMVTKEDMEEIGIKWKAVPCKKGQVRVTSPTLPHGADGPATGTRRTMLPWFVGVMDDCESLEITDGGTWEGLSRGHREMVGGETSPSGLPALFGTVPYRFPAAAEISGLGPLSDALVARIRWDSPLALLHRDKMLLSSKEDMWNYVRAWRIKAVAAAIESHQIVRKLEMDAYGEKSYYYNLEKSVAEGVPMPTLPDDFGPEAPDSDLSDSEHERGGTPLKFAEQGENSG